MTTVAAEQQAAPPAYPQLASVVTSVSELTPAYRRVRLHAPELAYLASTGLDDVVGLYLPRAGRPLVLPEPSADPRGAVAALPDEVRPDLRWYTIRAHDRASATLDVDIVSTGHGGPGCTWLNRVRAGDPVGVVVLGTPYASAPTTGRHLLVADESALPALLAIVEATQAWARAGTAVPRLDVRLEVPDRRFDHPDAVRLGIAACYRGTDRPGSALLAALEGISGYDYAWVCCEGGVAARVRQVVTRAGTPRGAVFHSGFWCLGRPRP